MKDKTIIGGRPGGMPQMVLEYILKENGIKPFEIAEVTKPQFEDTDMDLLIQIVKRYKDQDTWRTGPYFPKEGLSLLQNILDFV